MSLKDFSFSCFHLTYKAQRHEKVTGSDNPVFHSFFPVN